MPLHDATPSYQLFLGDSLKELTKLPENSVDSIVCDPPYELGFMNKGWDKSGIANSVQLWREALRVLKPGGHLLAFSGSRTYHRMACAIEDAGFEIRDQIMWVYGSGFPKSADVSKQIDQQEKDGWVKISKAIDNLNFAELTELWINSKSANVAGVKFQRKATEAGRNTQKNGFAHGNVLLQANRKNCDALAVIAELSLIEVHHTRVEPCSSAQLNAESSITESKNHATTAGKSPENHEATLCMVDFSALQSAGGWQGESKADKLKAVEALKIWLGSKPSSKQGVTNALCAALTDDLKLITLSQSKTFLSFDTTRQTACASAINATITESTAESLISFTVDTLKSKAIEKAAGAEREVIGVKPGHEEFVNRKTKGHIEFKGSSEGFDRPWMHDDEKRAQYHLATAPATEAAKKWQGWGTALKPAHEPICLARKPFKGTVARNVLSWGTGAINIQGCKVKADPNNEGRWPANFVHDGSEEVLATFPEAKGQQGALTGNEPSAKMGAANCYSPMSRRHSSTPREEGDKSAARFFYCAKASPSDRHEGLVNPGPQFKHGATLRSIENTNTTGNNHPTVKPTKLMQWLCRLVTPPGGTVLDLFMGSGSTGKACMIEGFNFIGIELNPDYMAIATARIMHANKELRSAEIA